jgi:hypothetical protein
MNFKIQIYDVNPYTKSESFEIVEHGNYINIPCCNPICKGGGWKISLKQILSDDYVKKCKGLEHERRTCSRIIKIEIVN